jgi:uncharacterized protein (TIGR02145 family)
MKKHSLLFALFLLQFSVNGQNDTIFIMRHGIIIYQKPLSEIDSILYYRDDFNLTGTFFDSRDSTTYPTIIIGNQIWFAANLKYLPSVNPPSQHANNVPHYYVYDYIGNNRFEAKTTPNYQKFGVLYNYRAALTACPAGWHLPTSVEFQTLIEYVGGATVAGGNLKTTEQGYWNPPNSGATNESGFSGHPGGFYRYQTTSFQNLNNFGYYWSSLTPPQNDIAVGQVMALNSTSVVSNIFITNSGFSVRCIRDPF